MKQRLLQLQAKIDAMSVRERAMIFAAAAAVIVFLFNSFMITPLMARHKALRSQIAQQQDNIAGMDAEIGAIVRAYSVDPDQSNRERLASVKARSAALGADLRSMQTGLVAPERIAPLLEQILRANGKLRLIALRSLPVSPAADGPYDPDARVAAIAAPAADAAAAASPTRLIYRHGVQVTVRGNYLDMIDYLDALEGLPTQMFWAKASMEVEEYPNARLTLTLYTLSLDQKWIKL